MHGFASLENMQGLSYLRKAAPLAKHSSYSVLPSLQKISHALQNISGNRTTFQGLSLICVAKNVRVVTTNAESIQESAPQLSEEKRRMGKRKVALFVGYEGTGYKGKLRNATTD